MKNKQWLMAIAIIIVLIFAFFWSGNQYTGTIKLDKGTINRNLNDTGLAASAKEQQEEQYNDRAVTEADRPDAAITIPETRVLPDSDTEEKSPPNEKKKIPEESKKCQKDKYLTDPVPEGRPEPVEWQDVSINKNKQSTCTLSVTCETILDNMDRFNNDKLDVLPENGIIFKAQAVTFSEGESVFDVLLREMKKNKIHMEFEMTPLYNSNYIEGIHNLYEFDCGELSGWMYRVNGWFPNYGCSRYTLKDGDAVEWLYTCDLGRDIGGGMAAGGEEE